MAVDALSYQALLLDIEGTTTPISFVSETLFPYARERLTDFLAVNWDAGTIDADLEALQLERAADEERGLDPPAWPGDRAAADASHSAAAYAHWLMDQDRKSTGLKGLQGKIWDAGYRDGSLRSQVYPDVVSALQAWQRQQKPVCIFSSGSALAQRLLFTYSEHGDLTGYLGGYFDTAIGPKKHADSYRQIARLMAVPAAGILFVSDVVDELDAAHAAGMRTCLSIRPGNQPQGATSHPSIAAFDELSGG